jgi:phosphohistidine phosphatase
MILYLVRHGIALDRTDPVAPPDPERPLTSEGIEKTRAAAKGLRELGVEPDAMITSPYLRAAQTAEIFCEVLEFSRDRIRRSDALKPGGDPAQLFKELSRARGQEVMCFGHAPQLDQAISYAFGLHVVVTSLKKAGVACLDVQNLSPLRTQLVWLFPAKALRKLT